MNLDPVTLTLPFLTWHGLHTIFAALGIAGASGLVWLMLHANHRTTPPSLSGLLVALAWILLPVWLLLLAATLQALWLVFNGQQGPLAEGSLGLGALVAAFLGAPFVIWAAFVKKRTIELQERTHFNERLGSAVQALHARRQVTSRTRSGSSTNVLTEWQDDNHLRGAAVDTLYGLAQELPDLAPRIADLLSSYVREAPLEDIQHGVAETDASRSRQSRSGVKKAARTLGLLKRIEGVKPKDVRIDLRGAILDRFDLSDLDFSNAILRGARMEECNLTNTVLTDTILSGALLNKAHLEAANLHGADLRKAYLQEAVLARVKMNGETKTGGADCQHALFRRTDLSLVRFTAEQIGSAFGDASVALPDALKTGSPGWPVHWPRWELPTRKTPDIVTQWKKWRDNPAGYAPPPPPAG